MEKLVEKLLKRYHKEITYLKFKLESENFGLCFGAGISKELNFPTWNELVKRIAEKINALELYNNDKSLSTITQLLFSDFRKSWIVNEGKRNGLLLPYEEKMIKTEWINIIHSCLYNKDISHKVEEIEHPYLKQFLDIIEKSSMTINYNFDDSIERLLFHKQKINNCDERKFETVWKPACHFRRKKGIIYHPNGYLPLNLSEGYSEHFVFSEESFLDQSHDSFAGNYSSLINHISKFTLLLLGLSLEDQTFKQILRQNARMNPGHFHFYVYWLPDTSAISDQERNAIVNTNFQVYNLITLFLTNEEIATLGSLLAKNLGDLYVYSDRLRLPLSYNYFLTGAIGTGKTTSINNLRSFKTFDEWTDTKHQLLSKSPKELTPEQKIEIDDWIDDQFHKKNIKIKHAEQCVSLIDRTLIDPLAFQTDESGIISQEKLIQRSEELLELLSDIPQGSVIILKNDPDELFNRVRHRNNNEHTRTTIEDIKRQQDFLIDLFADYNPVIIETRGLSEYEVTKQISSVVFQNSYSVVNFNEILKKIIIENK